MLFQQFFDLHAHAFSYLIAGAPGTGAIIIDPVDRDVKRYLAALRHYDLKLELVIDTHLHADHVSALRDYPEAVLMADAASVSHFLRAGWLGRTHKGCFAELLPDDLASRVVPFDSCARAEAPLGLGEGFDLFADGSVLAVPLPGHMRGHTGFVFTGGATPILYAADADWLRGAILEDRSPGFPASLVLHDKAAARETTSRIRRFVELGGDLVLCHDPDVAA